ncbi:MAG: FAD-dependent oxidoreductase [Acidobacteriaceae bacterium]
MKSDIVVVGGGPAGSAAAILLARAGRDVILLERDAHAQHKVCGEFLSRETLRYLDFLGIHVREAGGLKIESVRLASGAKVNQAVLPFEAMSLTRKTLDELLLQRAADSGVKVLRGRKVELIERSGAAWRAVVEGDAASADAIFLATGKHDLRGRSRDRGSQSQMVAFKMYWQLSHMQAAALEGHVELMLYAGGYAGLQPVEGGMANLCCLIERSELQRLGGRWEHLLGAMRAQCGLLRQRLEDADALLDKPLAITSIPYGYVRASSDGVWALGDQAAVIPSFTGDGMAIALHSGCLAASLYLDGASAEQFQERLHGDLSMQVSAATMISRGLVWAPSRGILTQSVRVWPGLLNIIARQTRISEGAVLV